MSFKAGINHADYWVRYLDQESNKDLEFYKATMPAGTKDIEEKKERGQVNTWTRVVENTVVTRAKSHLLC